MESSTKEGKVAEAGSGAGYERAKRIMDVIVALVGLILLFPFMLIIGAVIWITTPGLPILVQTRIGRNERPFTMLKFRTMYVNNDDSIHREYVIKLLTESSPPHGGIEGIYKLCNDPRVTRVGGMLRRASLDELPQLFNVLKGDMSLVGPRPVLPWEVDYFAPRHRPRFQVRPGITGQSQVGGRGTLIMAQALDIDAQYVHSRSFVLDMAILVKTAAVILRGDGAK